MNDKKICFIYCVNDTSLFEESKNYVLSLEVPSGFELEVLSVEDVSSIASGYNSAMKTSDAKYKVYLQQDVFIINKQFLAQMIELFTNNPDVGMIGMIGAKKLPTNGLWRESAEKYGKLYENRTGTMGMVSYWDVASDLQVVEVVDGLLMATQYDLPWREDLFEGSHFYDMAQSIEFQRAGYKVAIPNQDTPWTLHDCGTLQTPNYYDRNLFIHQYQWNDDKSRMLPLVSILIPTYNRPVLFELALRSALEQSYPNVEIIVCDDSTNNETELLINTYLNKFNHIQYVKNEKNLGQFQNDLKLLELANGEYINFLMDDDLFHPEKIEKMMNFFIADTKKEIAIVTSHRLMIDEQGTSYPESGITKKLFDNVNIIDGLDFGNFVLEVNGNYIGEPTTALFRKDDLTVPFGTFSGREYGCNVDMATWLNLLAKGKIVYIPETLSYFRVHGGQQLQSEKMLVAGAADYMHEVLYAPQFGFFNSTPKYLSALRNAKKYVDFVVDRVGTNVINEGMNEVRRLYRNLTDTIRQLEEIEVSNLPLVSILIPAYNRPHYLELALNSVLNQTYKNIEIIICDDSTNDEVQEMIQPYLKKYTRIHYSRNAENLGPKNIEKCLELSNGEYINFLMDDDLFHPEKIERMINFFLRDKEVRLVTSYRKLIDHEGTILPDSMASKSLFKETTTIDGKILGNHILINGINYIGEPTTVLFKKADLTERANEYKGKKYLCLSDLVSWMHLLSKGKAVYCVEPLSYFRQHTGQNQRKTEIQKVAIKEWFQLITEARQDGFLNSEKDYKVALVNYLSMASNLIRGIVHIQGIDLLSSEDLLGTLKSCMNELVVQKI